MSNTLQKTQTIRNLGSASQGATSDRRPLLLLESDLEILLEDGRKGIPLNFPAPQLAHEELNQLWPNAYQEVRRFFVSKMDVTPWDNITYAHTFPDFLLEGIELTRQEGPLFWTVHNKNGFHLIIRVYKRIPPGSMSTQPTSKPVFVQQGSFAILLEEMKEIHEYPR